MTARDLCKSARALASGPRLVAASALGRMRLPVMLMAVLSVGACTATRTTPAMPCAGDQHCPADGKWQCDLVQKRCVPCAGSCVGADAGAADGASADVDAVDAAADASPSDVAAAADTSGATDGDSGDASDSSDVSDVSDSAEPADSTAAIQSCAGRCGKLAVDEVTCFCDFACAANGDCCSDYQSICEPGDATDADGASLDASGDGSQTDALAEDTTATGD